MEETDKKEVIPNKFKGKGKQGLYCGFRQGHYCNENCGMFCLKLSSCVLHGINQNLRVLVQEVKKLKENDK